MLVLILAWQTNRWKLRVALYYNFAGFILLRISNVIYERRSMSSFFSSYYLVEFIYIVPAENRPNLLNLHCNVVRKYLLESSLRYLTTYSRGCSCNHNYCISFNIALTSALEPISHPLFGWLWFGHCVISTGDTVVTRGLFVNV